MERSVCEKNAKARWDSIAKPIDSLGKLEKDVIKLAGIFGSSDPEKMSIDKRALLVLCADHGVVEEGVTQTGKDVTKTVAENFAAGKSTVNLLAQRADCDVFPVDIGMDTEPYPAKELKIGSVADFKVARGTKNLARTSAMTIPECRQAIETGFRLVRDLKSRGYRIILTGEMGIGNTTPTGCLAAMLLHQDPATMVGRGAGLSDVGLKKKREVVEAAVKRATEKQLASPTGLLAEVGGFEIAAMCGIYLAAVQEQIPVVIDGAISAVAALAASALDPHVPAYCLASHLPAENAGRMALERMNLDPVIDGHLALGEGSGGVMLLPLLDMALDVYTKMGTFEAYSIGAYQRFGNEPRF
ncbi:MAG: nicotinate-nucleotide--dimethylbenzimidazole phosphoribosyltransferase [Lachnospiraceae bacterium]|nr:nicotinate-nucleotide--dimethylbenzimidazole phosphoribosyltransferase [Lachnospiraceae bacterium]